MSYCPKCGTAATPGGLFCASCGEKLPQLTDHLAKEPPTSISAPNATEQLRRGDPAVVVPSTSYPIGTLPQQPSEGMNLPPLIAGDANPRPGHRAAGVYLLALSIISVFTVFVGRGITGKGAEACGELVGGLLIVVLPLLSAIQLLGKKRREGGRKIALGIAIFLVVAFAITFGTAIFTSKTSGSAMKGVFIFLSTLLVVPGPLFILLWGNKAQTPELSKTRFWFGVSAPILGMLFLMAGVLAQKLIQ